MWCRASVCTSSRRSAYVSGRAAVAPTHDSLHSSRSMLDTVILVAILVVLIGILAALKAGFNEVIKALEALAAKP